MNLAWPIEIDMPGIAFGYSTFNRNLRAEVEVRGATISDDADVGVFVGPADLFDPQWPANVLVTMYETETIPPSWVNACNRADLVVVPCRHNREAFKRSGVSRPIQIMRQGVTSAQWPSKRREPRSPFTVLFVGWPNQRKGMDILAQAFLTAFLDDPDTVLYLKTSQALDKRLASYTLGGLERLIIDDRQLDHAEMVDLYHSAQVFVLPSHGEGWGLPALEAMATGCPVVATGYSGLAEFVTPTTGWPIRHGWVDVEYGHLTRAAQPDLDHLVTILRDIRSRYDAAAAKAMNAAAWVHQTLTWRHSAERLLELIEPLTRRETVWREHDVDESGRRPLATIQACTAS